MNEKVYLDANVLIAHQIKGHGDFELAKKLIEKLWHQKVLLFVSSLTFDEFWYGISVLLREQVEDKPFSCFAEVFDQLLTNILSWQNVKLVSFRNSEKELKKVLRLIKKYNLRPRDAFHLRIMNQQSIKTIATLDNDFRKVEEESGVVVLPN